LKENIFLSIRNNPVDFFRRVLYKLTVGRIKYGRGDDYDAGRYWADRFSKYGRSLRGAGDESLSEDDNIRLYAESSEVFLNLCLREGISFKDLRVLEIGCGTGFYTKILYRQGVMNYTGVDITDVLFPMLREMFPRYNFIKRDITVDKIDGEFDLVVMIDVIQHIVNNSKFAFALRNIDNSLVSNGILVLSPITDKNRKRFFYLRTWSLGDIKKVLPYYNYDEIVEFKYSNIALLRK
jgi:2-polyprenyl-3-methyl-5-hydroxy-6-metoxy-1,4-benzoquinol methylase